MEINNHWHFKAMCQVHKFSIVANILDPMVQQCVLNQSQGYWLLYNARIVAISFVCQMQVDSMTFDTNETQDFDSEIQFLQQCMQKQLVQVLNPFLSFMIYFQTSKIHNNMLTMMINTHSNSIY